MKGDVTSSLSSPRSYRNVEIESCGGGCVGGGGGGASRGDESRRSVLPEHAVRPCTPSTTTMPRRRCSLPQTLFLPLFSLPNTHRIHATFAKQNTHLDYPKFLSLGIFSAIVLKSSQDTDEIDTFATMLVVRIRVRSVLLGWRVRVAHAKQTAPLYRITFKIQRESKI